MKTNSNNINWYPAFCVDYANGYLTHDNHKGFKCVKKIQKISRFKQKKIHRTIII